HGSLFGLHLGLPDAGRDDHRPVESESEEIPLRDLLLRPQVLFALPPGAYPEGSRPAWDVVGGARLDRRGRNGTPRR
ncbi:MAG: hypothetical protein IID60_03245, partial [Proteobacteria bacterium]|nr:hypothetical protein [Pseudomonadota bacterium]